MLFSRFVSFGRTGRSCPTCCGTSAALDCSMRRAQSSKSRVSFWPCNFQCRRSLRHKEACFFAATRVAACHAIHTHALKVFSALRGSSGTSSTGLCPHHASKRSNWAVERTTAGGVGVSMFMFCRLSLLRYKIGQVDRSRLGGDKILCTDIT